MKQAKIRIMVADDHTIVRDGIVSIVAGKKDLQLVAQAANGVEALLLVKKHLPDILLLDLRMPGKDGLEVIAQIQSLQLATRVIVLTTFESEQDIHLALKAGARGYLLKDTPRLELLDAIRRVYCGETCIPPRISQKLVEKMNRPELTEREGEILRLIAEGDSNKAIGDKLGITEGTVKTHVKGLLKKLHVPGRTAAVKEAVHQGLIHLA
ncbi:MAG TPA: response regulator transcription factor [Gemmataceae bacterium]|jgi:two-component system NarL family response regulator|nr:response regulator transcription factor [Gemmataceae bacterium]